MPTTIVVDGDGQVVDRLVGPQTVGAAARRVARARRLNARPRRDRPLAGRAQRGLRRRRHLLPLALRLAARAGLPLVRLGRLVPRSRRPDAPRDDRDRRPSCSASARSSRRSARARARSAMLLTEHRRTLEIVSGLLIVLMGAVLAGFGGMLLQQERRLQPARTPGRAAGRRARRRGLRHRLDALRRADAGRDPGPGRPLRPCARRRDPAGGLLARPGRPVPALGPAVHARAREPRRRCAGTRRCSCAARGSC